MGKKDQLLLNWKDQTVHTSSWFKSQNVSNKLIYKYVKKGLIKKLGRGAYIKAEDKLNWKAAILTAQKELKLPLHVEGESALELQKSGHFIKYNEPTIYVALRKKQRVPSWLKKNKWKVNFKFRISTIFKDEMGLETYEQFKFPITLSSRERAIMEFIDRTNLSDSFESLEQYFESLLSLRTDLTQKLLENCSSVKVKRVFLYMASKLDLPIIRKLNTNSINLGKGKRVIFKNGIFDKKYKITVPMSEKNMRYYGE